MPARQQNSLKLLVLGLDGAAFDFIDPLIGQGRLPHLARLKREGVCGPLRSTLPPVTAAAWSTFMTGVNPGRHGIFQWRTYDPTRYTNLDERVVTADRLAGRTFWDILGRAGQRVAVITVPVTYPPWPINGYMVSGYPCPDAQRNYTYPAEWAASLEESYNFSADHYLHASEEQILQDGLNMLRRRTDLALRLISQEQLDCCVLVLGEIDRAQHDFFKYADPRFSASRQAPAALRQAIQRHYEVADEQVGRLLEALAPGGLALIVSDHGGGPHPPRYFHTNAWLRARGWLCATKQRTSSISGLVRQGIARVRRWLPFEEALRRRLPATIVNRARSYTLNIADVDWSHTAAYRFPMYYPAEGIEINLKGRQPQGCIEPGADYERVINQIVQALREVRDPVTGETIVQEVWRRAEIYVGPYLEIAPDVVFVCRSSHRTGVELQGDYVGPVPLDTLQQYNGVHTMDGIFFAHGMGVASGREIVGARLVDIAPTVLYLAGLPLPREMDGRVLTEILVAQESAAPATYVDTQPQAGSQASVTVEEEDAMLAKLRGLGYVE